MSEEKVPSRRDYPVMKRDEGGPFFIHITKTIPKGDYVDRPYGLIGGGLFFESNEKDLPQFVETMKKLQAALPGWIVKLEEDIERKAQRSMP